MSNAENNQHEMSDLLDMPDLRDMPELGDAPEATSALDLTASAEIPIGTIGDTAHGDAKAKPTFAVSGAAVEAFDDTDDLFDSLLAEMKMKTHDSFSLDGDNGLPPFGFEGDTLPVISPLDDLDSLIGALEAETPHALSPPDTSTVELDLEPINLPAELDSESDAAAVAHPGDLPDIEFVEPETSYLTISYLPMIADEGEREAVAFTANEQPLLDAFNSESAIAENDLDGFADVGEFQPLEVVGQVVDDEFLNGITAQPTLPAAAALNFTGVEEVAPPPEKQAETIEQVSGLERLIDPELVVALSQKPEAIVERNYETLDLLIKQIDEEVAAHPLTLRANDEAASSALSTSIDVATEHHVIFTLNETTYSLPVGSVLEISTPLTVTPLPNVPVWVEGIANLRGDIISVVDLRQFFEMEGKESSRGNRMLVVRSQHEDITSGLIVDSVREISYLNVGRITAPTAPVESGVAPYMRGVYEHKERLLVLLDPEKLMLSPEMQQFELAANS